MRLSNLCHELTWSLSPEMRESQPQLIISFASTTDALAVDHYAAEHHLPGRLIPLPRAISAGCGMSWKAAPEDEALLRRALKRAGLNWQQFHVIAS